MPPSFIFIVVRFHAFNFFFAIQYNLDIMKSQNRFTRTRFYYFMVIFHMSFYCFWGEVRYIEVPLYSTSRTQMLSELTLRDWSDITLRTTYSLTDGDQICTVFLPLYP